jgi:hypothetical protein
MLSRFSLLDKLRGLISNVYDAGRRVALPVVNRIGDRYSRLY